MLEPGHRIGPCEVLAPLGAGGMGEVYRARDVTLRREVALKTLPEAVAGEPNRLSRLRREARILASLSHPGIATLHGLEESSGGVPVLVMELVRGETLAERLHRGPLPLKEVLRIGGQIAEALSSAHEKGVIHRDLKPANISLTPESHVKLLDFGLARALEESEPELHSQLSTASSPVSDANRVLGTAPYMSPEQARGEQGDRRTDIWAFGCVLYELLSGKRAFPGATFSETAAMILAREPDWSALPEGTPATLRRLLQRCLRKERDERLRDAADASLELRDTLAELSSGTGSDVHVATAAASATGRASRKRMLTVGLGVGLGLAALGLLAARSRRTPVYEERPQHRFQLALPRGVTIPGPPDPESFFAISPDGERVAFVGCKGSRDTCLLYVRDLREVDPRPLADTEGASCPFFSPDGRFIGFGANDKLKKVSVDGGRVVTLTDAAQLRGGSWGEDGTILFTNGRGGLVRIAADGSDEARRVSELGASDYDHRWPLVLPGGQAAVFTVVKKGLQGQRLEAIDLEEGRSRTLLDNASDPHITRSGHLLFGYGWNGTIFGVGFDARRLAVAGQPIPLLEGVRMAVTSGAVYYDVARDGTLVFAPGSLIDRSERSSGWIARAV